MNRAFRVAPPSFTRPTTQPPGAFTDRGVAALWGSYEYTPDKDVVRAPMTLASLPFSVDQLTWEFVDMTDAGGKIAIMWDKNVATVPFKVQM